MKFIDRDKSIYFGGVREMYYILVKNSNSVGSVVYELNDSKEVDMLDDFLNYKLEGKDKQVVLLSNLDMLKEYEPFNIVNTAGEFIDKAILN
ncbi:MAG: hypothetical protein N4A48_08300 [Tepidibacter sp.]|jgi:hypothetical protein|uniref:DUF6718 family protein n=1 Tax=Tepidibacter sp. TaxID=2529387 RepID=UPI0025FC4B4E|nr:DUF6718 family protein [Tepidibacter sp.]MCT4508747.1 hypothetical protein [Tepidibacter sp.]